MKIIERKNLKSGETSYYFDSQKVSVIPNVLRSSSYADHILSWLKEVFLPQGYPASVSDDYINYQIWDSFQAYFSNLAGALSLHSTLVGIGVGREAASPLAAALSWLTQDGAGMISSIAFAYWKGSDLDNNSKQWRLFGDAANDIAHFVKLLAPILPFPIVFTLCISSVILSLVGVAGGCTRASLIQHQALCNNMADVSAKDGSQETLVNLTGLITSLTFLPYLTSTALITWVTFLLCIFCHFYCNYRAMRVIHMKTLNRARLCHILRHWVVSKQISNISSTNNEEPFLFGPAFLSEYLTSSFHLEMGASLGTVLKSCLPTQFETFYHQKIFSHFIDQKFKLFVGKNRRKIFVVLHKDADATTILNSFWAAFLLALNLNLDKDIHLHQDFCFEAESSRESFSFIELIEQKAQESFPQFYSSLLSRGWVIDPLRLNVGEWRVHALERDDKKKN